MRLKDLVLVAGLLLANVAAQTPLALQLVASGFDRPVMVTAPPGDLDRLFVVEQVGRVWILEDGVVLPTPFLDVTSTGPIPVGGEAGLLAIAFHPDYAQNGEVYVYRNALPYIQALVERYTVSADPDVADAASRTLIWTTAMVYGNHNGGGIAFGPDGYLYVPVGDGGSPGPTFPNDPHNHAQRGDSWLGKILRIDVDNPQPPLAYGIPASNPFVGDPNMLDEVWALGVRNPWRCTFDRLTGDYYIGDVGGRNEEIDFEPAGFAGGRNYGWSCMAGTYCNGNGVCACGAPALTPPLHEYDLVPQQAVIGGYVYRGCAIPDLRGSYFFADYITNQVWTLQHDGVAVTSLVERTAELPVPMPQPFSGITGFGEDGYGELYMTTRFGDVYKIVPQAPVLAGVQPYGVGTPGCAGPHALGATCSPVVGNPLFAMTCSNAPPSAFGLMAFANAPDVAGSDLLGIGLLVHVDVTAGFLVLEVMLSDAAGLGGFAFAIPPTPSLAGVQLHAQAIWGWDPGACLPTPWGWSSSDGLTITLQG